MDAVDLVPTPVRKARIEIIPLIDVIFFLLATFVLFTLSLQKIRMMDLDLPKGGTDPEEQALIIQASHEGTFYWQRDRAATPELITTAELRPRLLDYRRSVSVPRVLIRSDRHAKFGAGVHLLDEVRLAGIKQVSVETMPGR